MVEKRATKKAIKRIKDGEEPKGSKRFKMVIQLRCPDCGAIMVTEDDSVHCCNTGCESLGVRYRAPTIALVRK